MIKYTLHKISEGFIITSDEEIKEKDYVLVQSKWIQKCEIVHDFDAINIDWNFEIGFCTIAGTQCKKIIATDTSLKIEGIPQFKLEEADRPIYKLANIHWKNYHRAHSLGDNPVSDEILKPYVEFYKAAQSGCFTEEKCLGIINLLKNLPKGQDEEEAVRKFLKQPKQLVAIEIETYNTGIPIFTGKGYSGEEDLWMPKKTISEEYPDGLLTVKEYFYEKK